MICDYYDKLKVQEIKNVVTVKLRGCRKIRCYTSCDNGKEIWDKLKVVHEGTNEVKETKIGLLNLNYENFKMDPNEDIKAMFNRLASEEVGLFTSGITGLQEEGHYRSQNLMELKLDELIGSLLTHELMSKPLIREKVKKIKEQDINVNVIALKSSKKLQEDSSEEESEEEDEEMAYLVKNFTRFMKIAEPTRVDYTGNTRVKLETNRVSIGRRIDIQLDIKQFQNQIP
ncbi:hypothetical protein GQ457_06G012770 [Hibiscus cannabinus]